jgi:hypothetical protein
MVSAESAASSKIELDGLERSDKIIFAPEKATRGTHGEKELIQMSVSERESEGLSCSWVSEMQSGSAARGFVPAELRQGRHAQLEN